LTKLYRIVKAEKDQLYNQINLFWSKCPRDEKGVALVDCVQMLELEILENRFDVLEKILIKYRAPKKCLQQ